MGAQRHAARWLEAVAAFAIALTSALAIADPRAAIGHVPGAVDLPIELVVDLVSVSPIAAPLAAVVAVCVCAALRNSRWAWPTAATATTLQAVLRIPVSDELETQVSIAAAVFAGIALGAVAATAWRRSAASAAVAVVAGFFGAMLLKHLSLQDFTYRPISRSALAVEPMMPSPPVWPFAIAAVAAVASALVARPPASGDSPRQPRLALAAVALTIAMIATEYLAAQWLVERRIDVLVAMTMLFATTLVAAIVLARMDGPWSGAFLLTTTAVVAASHLAGGSDVSLLPRDSRWWLLLVAAALLAGLALGVRLHHRPLRIVFALLAVAAVLEPASFMSLLAIAALGGFAMGVSLPGAGPLAVSIALSVPTTGIAFAATTDTVTYPNSSTRLAATAVVIACALGTVAVGWFSQATLRRAEVPSPGDAKPS
ncbi:hypothetical protein [Antrihabitans sp. YC2-6]|uniref:hypothetical protein n=1 Tax=Antrihabitans sp. YC2-6 TaxID=2799498 RepID=UPI0018F6E6D7|nr:hypothetical protein [Antrihabitans sp. YC2-6]MBJ8348601.1 hypothetical protein [Antrihabitans sp. YC2-6]